MLHIVLIAAVAAVTEWDYAIQTSYYHDPALSTYFLCSEGIHLQSSGVVLESTGLYNSSMLYKLNLATGDVLMQVALSSELYGAV
jgi:glutamine cyclotransferase